MTDMASPAGAHQPLPRIAKLLYSLPQVPLMMVLLPMTMFLPELYTGQLKLDLAIFANVLFAVSLFVIVTDPLIGYLSDKTQTKYGRRMPWIIAGASVAWNYPITQERHLRLRENLARREAATTA